MSAATGLFLMGANHKSAPMEIREKLYIPSDKLSMVLPGVREKFAFTELCALSTCNRFELIGVMHPEPEAEARLFEAYMHLQEVSSNLKALGDTDLRDNVYVLRDLEAVQHVYKVASSLDSLVVGETQITGQFKDAVQLALKAQTLGPMLNRLSQEALATAKKIRTQTAIGEKRVSISHAALDLAKKVFGVLGDHKYLVVGAGEMARVAAKNIRQYDPKALFVANRTVRNAREMVAEVGFGEAYPLEEMPSLLAEVDIVISSTAAAGIVLDAATIRRAQSARRGRPLILLDIALPRDIDPAAGELDDVYLFDIDDLQQVVGVNREERRKAAEAAQVLIDESVVTFEKWLATMEVKPVLAGFRAYLDTLLQKEFERTTGRGPCKDLTPAQRESLVAMMTAVAGKISGDASRQVKTPPEGFFREQLADALEVLFQAPAPDKDGDT